MLYDPTDPDYQAYFADAANAVQTVLAGARQQVVCALAQTCSRHCFDLLLQVSRRGVALRLLVPDMVKAATVESQSPTLPTDA